MDPKPLIIRKRAKTISTNVVKSIEPEKPVLVGATLGMKIAVARNEKGFNQKKLAALINKPMKDLREWESGTAKFDQHILDLIEKALGVKF